MKILSTLIYLFIAILFTLQTACQDRLIVLWDEGIKPLLVMDSMQIIEGEDEETEHPTFIANGSELDGSVVDIVMIIDNSGSMDEEISGVRSYINTLSSQMNTAQIDYHFIMISAKNDSTSGMVYGIGDVPSPLGGSERFMHLDIEVDSRNSLSLACNHFNQYSDFLRNNAILNFVIITDDNSSLSFSSFKNNMTGLDKPYFIMHGIIGLEKVTGNNVAHVGQVYIDGINETGGVKLDISTPIDDWGDLFNQLTENITHQIPPGVDYFLKKTPVIFDLHNPESSFTVKIGGFEIPPTNTWTYNSHSNSIHFLDPGYLKDGDIIDVKYTIKEEVPPGMVYFLENEPIIKDEDNPEASFKVWINTDEIQSPGNWKYVKGSNSIHFLIPGLLHESGTIEVEYKTMP